MENNKIVELAHDVQSGLANVEVPDFDRMRIMGMAASLAIHIRGLGEINYEILRKVSSHYFKIPSGQLKEVIEVLGEIEYLQIVKSGKTITAIIPDVPRFKDVYEGVGDYFSFSELNEHEQGTLLILSELQKRPENRDSLIHTTGMNKAMLDRCEDIGTTGHYLKSFRARGKDILISPFYFADNLGSLADITAKIGAKDIQVVIEIIKNNQGWPLSIIKSRLEVGGTTLTPAQNKLLVYLCSEGILKPPSIYFNTQRETFVFTPAPGSARLDASNREVYERAMALVSCVRKGQLLADRYRIKFPVALLRSLQDKGYLGANSEAVNQYRNLVALKVGTLKKITSSRWQFCLIRTEENVESLRLAISLLSTGELANLEVNQEARLAFSSDESYIQSVISSAELKVREKVSLEAETADQFEQLMLSY